MKKIYKNLNIISEPLEKILHILDKKEHRPRIIGGYVRDKLLSIENNDIDIASPLKPEVVMNLLVKHNIKTIPTGIEFGTVTAIVGNNIFEITSLRKDIKCDGRRAVVEFTEDFALDAERRDFTINSLSYCPFEHIIYDYTNGLHDLASRKVRFIGNASDRIKEDYLRILRFFRFSSNYAEELDSLGYIACQENHEGIKTLSRERINSEMDKILLSKKRYDMLSTIKKIDLDVFDGLNIDEEILSDIKGNDLNVIYAGIFAQNDLSILKTHLNKLGFSKFRTNMILKLQALQNSEDVVCDLLECWIDGKKMEPYLSFALSKKLITKSDSLKLTDNFNTFPPVTPVKSWDLIEKGITGEKLGISLKKSKRKWIKSNFTLQKKDLLRDYIL